MHICIVTITSRGRKCGEAYGKEQLMIFAAAPHRALSVAVHVGIESLSDTPSRRPTLAERG
jgi:hypothetical protein